MSSGLQAKSNWELRLEDTKRKIMLFSLIKIYRITRERRLAENLSQRDLLKGELRLLAAALFIIAGLVAIVAALILGR